jgi:histidinol-phosphate aminotransferase
MTVLPTEPLSRIRPDVRAMHAYVVQDAQGLVKLDAMENPHRLPGPLQVELGQRLGAVALNRYPGSRLADLHKALLQYAAPPPGFDLMLGNGSLAPLPGFVMYAMSAQLQGLDFVGVPLRETLNWMPPCWRPSPSTSRRCLPGLSQQPHRQPVGRRRHGAHRAAQRGAALVVIDEAYQPFSSRSYLDAIRANPAATYPMCC